MGTVRSLADYYRFADIDIVNKKVYTNFCKENNKANEDDIYNSNEHNHKVEKLVIEIKKNEHTNNKNDSNIRTPSGE